MRTPEEIADFRSKMIEHLEAALALADETGDSTAGYMIETALDAVRADARAERHHPRAFPRTSPLSAQPSAIAPRNLTRSPRVASTSLCETALDELDADLVAIAPRHATLLLDLFRFNDERKLVRYSERGCDLEASTGC
jgi:hypothetical protein